MDIVVQSDLFIFLTVFSYFSLLPFSFRFLFDKSSLEYLYYNKKVAELKKALERAENKSSDGKITIIFSH